ncbi:MAG: two component system histidine kinase [Gammaproteobacteria bacterium]|nr:two component system histidine kinase [Gammaproteobacteria bacterium]
MNKKASYWASEKFLAEVLSRLPSYIFWKDRDCTYLGCNKTYSDSVGLPSPREIIGKTDYDLPWSKEESDAYRADDQEVMRMNRPKINFEEAQTTAEGKKITLLTSKVPLTDDNGEVIGILGIYNDITELKSAQNLLIEAKDKADIANKAKSEFIANMSHDLRTPMTGVLGMIEILRDTIKKAANLIKPNSTLSLDDYRSTFETLLIQIEEYASIAKTSSVTLINFFNEILEVLQLETTRSLPKPAIFNLPNLIQKNVDLFLSMATHKKITLSYRIAESVPIYVESIYSYLDRCLSNLIGNGLKFTEKGYVKILVTLEDEKKTYKAGDFTTIVIRVMDSGIGIPNDKFDTIFENFSRLTSSYDGIYPGTGLGLYTVKRYVEAMGGEIKVNSEIGKGSCFTLRLSLKAARPSDETSMKRQPLFPQPAQPAVVTNLTTSEKPGVANQASSVLVVEDNIPAAMVVRSMLNSLHWPTDLAKTGAQAVQMASQTDYDFILMDVGLPDFSGIEATKQIRSLNSPRSQVPIIALTGHGNDPQRRQEALDSGMQEVLTKPATLPDLENIVKRFAHTKDEIPSAESKYEKLATREDTSLAIINWDGCVQKCIGNVDFTKELLALFAHDLKASQETLAKHYTNRDEVALRAELHRVRGGISYLALPQLENALQIFHNAVKANPQGLESLDKQYKAVEQAMQAFWEEWDKRTR